ncbi:MAG: TIGR00266 family protein, partial [Cyanobacteria bacterium P01_H01_bin.121]
GQGLVVQSTSYLACTPGVNIDVGFPGPRRAFKSALAGEWVFWLDVTGQGLVLLSSFGAIYEKEVQGEYVIDSGHIVAYEKTLEYSIGKPKGSSWLSTFLGGEGFVCNFRGHGKVYCQTHNPGTFGQLVGSQLPPR